MVSIKEKWESLANKLLLGRRIVRVEYMSNLEANESMWRNRPITFILDDNTRVIAMCDDEGNDGGSLWVGKSDKEEVLPVLSITDND